MGGSFTYDGNGNELTDSRRAVTLTYNQLNLPATVMAGIRSATYLYDANGTKLKSVQTADGVTTTREYISGIQYTNGAIDFIQADEGMAVRNAGNGTYKYQYNLKDHLGNTRVSIDDNGSGTAEITQEDEYYAFGLDVPKFRLTTENKYLYNGKEKQDVLTDELDYGARFYDPVIARWTSVDPLVEAGQESTSPYGYVFDDPVRFKDPDGKAPCDPCDPTEDNGFLNYSSSGDKLVSPIRSAIHDFSVSVLDFLGVRDAVHVAAHLGDKNVSTTEKAIKVVQATINLVAIGEEGERVEINEPKVFEPYNRQSHYGKTPTAADRAQLGADKGTVVDHDPPLVKRYYEGDPKIGEKPGHQMTAAERKQSANDRSRMKIQAQKESHQQGAEMSRYSRAKKKENDL